MLKIEYLTRTIMVEAAGNLLLKYCDEIVKTKMEKKEKTFKLKTQSGYMFTENYGKIYLRKHKGGMKTYITVRMVDGSDLPGITPNYINMFRKRYTNKEHSVDILLEIDTTMIYTKTMDGESYIPLKDDEHVICYYNHTSKIEDNSLNLPIYLTSFGNIKIHSAVNFANLTLTYDEECRNLEYKNNYLIFKEEFNHPLPNDYIFILKYYFMMSLAYENVEIKEMRYGNTFISVIRGIRDVISYMLDTFWMRNLMGAKSIEVKTKNNVIKKQLIEAKDTIDEKNDMITKLTTDLQSMNVEREEIKEIKKKLNNNIKRSEQYFKDYEEKFRKIELIKLKLKLREKKIEEKEALLDNVDLPSEPGLSNVKFSCDE